MVNDMRRDSNAAIDEDPPVNETPFKPPEMVASEEARKTPEKTGGLGSAALPVSPVTSAKKLHHKFKEIGLRLWPTTKKQKIIGSIIALILVIGGVAGVIALRNYLDKDEIQPVSVGVPKTTEPSKLTGVEIDPKLNKRTVIAAMIENSTSARPQAGLKDAGVVFEAIAEGGITRYCALFLENRPKYLGPVRSVRPYYVDWLAGFDAAVAHAGGSAEGLAKVAKLHIKDLDYTKNSAFRRVSDRAAPHNLYTSMDELDKAVRQNKWKGSQFTGFKRKPELAVTGKPKVTNISFNISSELYNVRFKYDAKTNSYRRYLAGAPHNDHKTGKPIKPKVVVALITTWRQKGIYSVYGTVGSGKVIVYQDGKAQKGIWKKKSPKQPLQFFTRNGEPLRLNPGKTWVTALKSQSEAKHGP